MPPPPADALLPPPGPGAGVGPGPGAGVGQEDREQVSGLKHSNTAKRYCDEHKYWVNPHTDSHAAPVQVLPEPPQSHRTAQPPPPSHVKQNTHTQEIENNKEKASPPKREKASAVHPVQNNLGIHIPHSNSPPAPSRYIILPVPPQSHHTAHPSPPPHVKQNTHTHTRNQKQQRKSATTKARESIPQRDLAPQTNQGPCFALIY
jgi:hypothetical protein